MKIHHGTVVALIRLKFYGFLRADDATRDVFFHAGVLEDCPYWSLSEGDRMTFTTAVGQKGMHAEHVRRIES